MTESTTADLAQNSIRPLVAGSPSSRAVWIFAGAMVLTGGALFSALEASRTDRQLDPLAQQRVAGDGMIIPPTPLVIPDVPQAMSAQAESSAPSLLRPPSSAPSMPMAYSPPVLHPTRFLLSPPGPEVQVQPQRTTYGPAMVYQAQSVTPVAELPSQSEQIKGNQRVEAMRFANPSTTIPQGAVVQAVLETALDSTRPGPARAIVSRDVRSFDGTRVLIPRGSRLYGDYKADLAQGQSRALIQWTRLLRPDGVTIALDSPSADPLGRAGVGGKVNSHFLARFGNAFLQTSLNLGMIEGDQRLHHGAR